MGIQLLLFHPAGGWSWRLSAPQIRSSALFLEGFSKLQDSRAARGCRRGGGCDVLALSRLETRVLLSPCGISDCWGSPLSVLTAPSTSLRRRELGSPPVVQPVLPGYPTMVFVGFLGCLDPSEDSMIFFLPSCAHFPSSMLSSKFSCCSSLFSFG